MEVLVLNGSPRIKGNTVALTDAFAKEAQALGHNVSVVRIGSKLIRGCKNCDFCRNTLNGYCVQEDDMQEVYQLLRKCEVLVIASPVYYYSLNGQTHCAIERMYAFDKLPKLKKAALMLTAGGNKFDAAVQTFQDAIITHMNAEDMGMVVAVGEENKTEAKLEEARELARKI